mmetsp:Transcript_112195/g.317079  ORF Transcript_112195/g.317079 Transcript_112195/m.317079 type:complete len:223 (+) Transcript_112195:1050-1718(+)
MAVHADHRRMCHSDRALRQVLHGGGPFRAVTLKHLRREAPIVEVPREIKGCDVQLGAARVQLLDLANQGQERALRHDAVYTSRSPHDEDLRVGERRRTEKQSRAEELRRFPQRHLLWRRLHVGHLAEGVGAAQNDERRACALERTDKVGREAHHRRSQRWPCACVAAPAGAGCGVHSRRRTLRGGGAFANPVGRRDFWRCGVRHCGVHRRGAALGGRGGAVR